MNPSRTIVEFVKVINYSIVSGALAPSLIAAFLSAGCGGNKQGKAIPTSPSTPTQADSRWERAPRDAGVPGYALMFYSDLLIYGAAVGDEEEEVNASGAVVTPEKGDDTLVWAVKLSKTLHDPMEEFLFDYKVSYRIKDIAPVKGSEIIVLGETDSGHIVIESWVFEEPAGVWATDSGAGEIPSVVVAGGGDLSDEPLSAKLLEPNVKRSELGRWELNEEPIALAATPGNQTAYLLTWDGIASKTTLYQLHNSVSGWSISPLKDSTQESMLLSCDEIVVSLLHGSPGFVITMRSDQGLHEHNGVQMLRTKQVLCLEDTDGDGTVEFEYVFPDQVAQYTQYAGLLTSLTGMVH